MKIGCTACNTASQRTNNKIENTSTTIIVKRKLITSPHSGYAINIFSGWKSSLLIDSGLATSMFCDRRHKNECLVYPPWGNSIIGALSTRREHFGIIFLSFHFSTFLYACVCVSPDIFVFPLFYSRRFT